jgi:hypothetical protein
VSGGWDKRTMDAVGRNSALEKLDPSSSADSVFCTRVNHGGLVCTSGCTAAWSTRGGEVGETRVEHRAN